MNAQGAFTFDDSGDVKQTTRPTKLTERVTEKQTSLTDLLKLDAWNTRAWEEGELPLFMSDDKP